MRDHQGNPLRTTWILGAGFSRSLGGPLLPDLLRQEDLSYLRAKYPPIKYGDLADTCWRAQELFNWGKYIEGTWSNAEEFLDFVDCSDPRSPGEVALLRMATIAKALDEAHTPVSTDHTPSRLAELDDIKSGVVRALAAECSWFSRNRPVRPERWAPYEAWLASLNPGFNTLVSFNYDEVVEQLPVKDRLAVVLPHEAKHVRQDRVQLFKLHGSVTWFREDNVCRVAPLGDVLASPGDFLALGTPGRSKRVMKDSLFEPLWARAEQAIRSAEVVVFLGYRFPETDGDARRRILEAIRTNTSARLRAQVVLGTDPRSPAIVRVQRMLELSARNTRSIHLNSSAPHNSMGHYDTFELFVEPLLAEDYLALYAEDGPLSRWA